MKVGLIVSIQQLVRTREKAVNIQETNRHHLPGHMWYIPVTLQTETL